MRNSLCRELIWAFRAQAETMADARKYDQQKGWLPESHICQGDVSLALRSRNPPCATKSCSFVKSKDDFAAVSSCNPCHCKDVRSKDFGDSLWSGGMCRADIGGEMGPHCGKKTCSSRRQDQLRSDQGLKELLKQICLLGKSCVPCTKGRHPLRAVHLMSEKAPERQPARRRQD